MSFLHNRRSFQAFHVKEKEPKLAPARTPPLIPSSAAIENVPQKRSRYRTTSSIGASRIIRRVSSIFTPRKKAPPDLKLVNSALNNISTPRSYSSSKESLESEDDIRRPSGLGSAVSISSLPPSPYSPLSPETKDLSVYHTFPSGEFQRNRAISSPNLLRSLSWKVRGKTRARHASIVPSPTSPASQEPPPVPPLSPKPTIQFPEEIVVLILSHLPQTNVGLLATVSRTFVSAARKALYTTLDLDVLSPLQLEKLVALLASRWELTDLVMTFTCRTWPPFFLCDAHDPKSNQNDLVIQHKDALLTASFTLALERMSNLHSLTLPCFDFSLLSHHTAFGLKNLTFLNDTTTEAETRALFTWLDGQTNITSLRFTCLEDTHTSTKLSISSNIPLHDNTRPGTAPSSPYLKPFSTSGLSPYASPTSSPRSACFHRPLSPPTPFTLFTSSSLLPNLSTLHATPALLTLLTSPLETPSRRPLKSVTLNINTTLYNGLRPASLMSALRGVTHLALRFSENVDRRSFEKVLGAAGAALGAPCKNAADDPFVDAQNPAEVGWRGLQSLEISFNTITQATAQPVRDEALYKSLQASLPRYKALSSLHFFVCCSSDDTQGEFEKEKKDDTPSATEQSLIHSWIKQCPTLGSIVLFSGARWQQNARSVPQAAQPLFAQSRPALPQKRKSTTAYGGTEFKFP
ncbi:hypothetical protein GALMADRAFT_252173 [Galerina marginata CBS 339.88]|uniref:F-box domain-containing protein n=1 Tax=Galerina marginata (strain CBS 339.88) TaxID=685588 RepID=A0A067T1G1_GALM3|nr:hypothetical protein GALMADRAFT_252173 [Galerina marginata CBS 339.88]